MAVNRFYLGHNAAVGGVMREIKFRAWNKEFEEMCPICSLDICGGEYGGAEGSRPSGGAAVLMDGEFELMQYAGLKDSKGIEIYEGDIVRDHVGKGVVKYSDKHAAFRVSYGDGLAKWFYDYTLRGERESIEIIGNIHEHPELVKS